MTIRLPPKMRRRPGVLGHILMTIGFTQDEKSTRFKQAYPPRSVEWMSLKGKDERDYSTVLAQKMLARDAAAPLGIFL